MSNDKLIEAMARAMWDAEPQLDEWDRAHPEARCRRMNMARAALAALQREHVIVPREFEAAMASSGPRSGHSVEVLFKDREGALKFYAALKGLGTEWVQRQLDRIAAKRARGINVSGHTYVRRSATSYVCRRCGHDMCREDAKPCANQQPEEAPNV